MKIDFDYFDSIEDFIVSMVTVVTWVLLITIVLLSYVTVKQNGESTMLSYISTFFTIVSALGVLSGVFVYILQKKDKAKEQLEIDRKISPFVMSKSETMLIIISRIRIKVNNSARLGSKITMDDNDLIEEFRGEISKAGIKCNQHDDFIEKNKIFASKELFVFIIELDVWYDRIMQETSVFLNAWNCYYQSEEFFETGNNIDYEKLIINFNEFLDDFERHIINKRAIVNDKLTLKKK